MSGFKSTFFRESRLMASAKHPGVYLTVPVAQNELVEGLMASLLILRHHTFNNEVLCRHEEKRNRCQLLAQSCLDAFKRVSDGLDSAACSDLHVPPAFSMHRAICAQISAPLASTARSKPLPTSYFSIISFAYSCENVKESLDGSVFFGVTMATSAPYDWANCVRDSSISKTTIFLTP